jgi:hypothetical protein
MRFLYCDTLPMLHILWLPHFELLYVLDDLSLLPLLCDLPSPALASMFHDGLPTQ